MADDSELTQTDLALTSAVKALILIFLASGIAEQRTFDLYLGPMMKQYAEQGDLKAAELLRMLIAFATSPATTENLEARQTVRMLRDAPPAGSA